MKMVYVDPLSLKALEALRLGAAAFATFRAEHPEFTLLGYNDGWTKDPDEKLVTEGPDLIDVDEHAESFWLKGISLADVDLSGLKLFNLDFDRADLQDAQLVGCKIRMCGFDHSILQRADLSSSEIQNSNFRVADLRHAKLQRITLGGRGLAPVQFHWAVMAGADLTGATLDEGDFLGAYLWEVDLTDARGKDMTFHEANVKGLKGLASASFAHPGRMIGEHEYMSGEKYFSRLAKKEEKR